METPVRTVLFICEHGSAKSVVAAAHFNRLAAEHGLDLRAISRGTAPDDALHPAAVAGLASDGLAPAGDPVLLSDHDLADATRIVAFSLLPVTFRTPENVEIWEVPAVSEDYRRSRSAILAKLHQLLADIRE